MGNQRFRLSDMIPNAWFYKLRDMNTTNSHSHSKIKALPSPYSSTSNANSFNYTPRVHQFHTSPTSRKSLTKRTIIHKPISSNHALIQLTESPHANEDLFLSPTTNYVYESSLSESTQSFEGLSTTSCSCRVIDSSTSDIVIDFNEKVYNKKIQHSSGFDLIQDIEFKKLPPIITKPEKFKNTLTMVEKKEETCSQSSVSIKTVEENISKKETMRRKQVSGVKIGSNSLKTASRNRIIQGSNYNIFKSQKNNKRNFSDSCAIVKSSFDPQKDFKESMVEMIMENNIWESKDLEELLGRYLSLNSGEYHDTIVKAFEQIC